MKVKWQEKKGITLISLVVTIIILIILAGVSIRLVLGENGIVKKAQTGSTEYNKEAATETINFKITNVQMETYAQKQRMPTLKELADNFCEDDDFQYVSETRTVASLPPIESLNPTSIFTKLKAYPYEFEINSSLQLASIDGVEIAQNVVQPATDILFEGKSTDGGSIQLTKNLSDYSYIEIQFTNLEEHNACAIQKFSVTDIIACNRFAISESSYGWSFGSTYAFDEETNTFTNIFNMYFGGMSYGYSSGFALEINKIVGIK